ncbi:MAG: N-acetylmuramoyl-L-alanine amidase [Lachnospiraceae bacterium]|nr:N-acetylmuramoyl-L-alanine amidase [Lachnospiraceae bacterium]
MKKNKYWIVLVLFLLASFLFREQLSFLSVTNRTYSPSQVVIDVGHGGSDPGKVGLNNSVEKEINLKIGFYLFRMLTASGYSVTMTRTTDTSLASPHASNQKISDLNKRKEIMKNTAPMAVISIHQNSYSSESQHGSQVFYSSGSDEGKLLASCIQEQCRRILDPENTRQIKENNDYYLFRDNPYPTVIVECGFLSNYRESALLVTERYQEKTAWAIYMGTVQYLKKLE